MSKPDPKPPRRVKDSALLKQMHLEYAGEPCQDCERRPGVALHHVIYKGQGGSDAAENLRWLCSTCHDAAHGSVEGRVVGSCARHHPMLKPLLDGFIESANGAAARISTARRKRAKPASGG